MIIGKGNNKTGFIAENINVIKAEDMKNWMSSYNRIDPSGVSFELSQTVQEVQEGFFLLLPTINELIVLNPKCNIILNDQTIELFKKNNVLIRGEFDSNSEKLAKQLGLRFLHLDFQLATTGDINSREGVDIITLRFREDGSSYIHLNNYSTGSSSDWSGGWEKSYQLDKDFYLLMNSGRIAKLIDDRCYKEIKDNKKLKDFLKKSKKKEGFLIDYSIISDC